MPNELELVIFLWICFGWISIIALWWQSIKYKIDRWQSWDKRVTCRKCDMQGVCKHVHKILDNHYKSSGIELRFRCPVMDKRSDDIIL